MGVAVSSYAQRTPKSPHGLVPLCAFVSRFEGRASCRSQGQGSRFARNTGHLDVVALASSTALHPAPNDSGLQPWRHCGDTAQIPFLQRGMSLTEGGLAAEGPSESRLLAQRR
jgi:hypothetical protein